MKALFVATVQSHIAQFHTGAIKLLKENGYEVHVAARNNLAEKNGLKLENVDKVFDIQFNRSPFSSKNLGAYNELKKIINNEEYSIIHCNTPVGGIVTRLAAIKARKKGTQVIYTAHGFHFYEGAPKKNWLIYYPIEKLMAHFTDKLVTITQEDYNLASKKFCCPVYHVHGVGVKTQKYSSVTEEQVHLFRKEMGLQNKFIILCTGELNANKNQSTVIKAMPEILNKVPNAKLLLAGNGPYEEKLKQLISELKLEDSIELIGYRTDLEWYVHACDLVVTASFREGLPVNVLEAMFCKKAVVASNNRGHCELVFDGKNGYLVSPEGTKAFADKIIELAINKETRDCMGLYGENMVKEYTDINVSYELAKVYDIKENNLR